MTASDPAVDVVARVLAGHASQPRGRGDEIWVGCAGCDWRSDDIHADPNVDPSVCDPIFDASMDAAEAAHLAHQAEQVVAALRAAAEDADVEELAQVVLRAVVDSDSPRLDDYDEDIRESWRRIARAVLARLALLPQLPVAAGLWRVGTHYSIHVYAGDRPVATFHDPADARLAVDAVNAAGALDE